MFPNDPRHGTYLGYTVGGCRCSACRDASTAYAKRRRRLIAYGRWEPMVDAGPVRAHAQSLLAAGLTVRDIASMTGVGMGGMCRLLYGQKGRPRAQRVRHETAAAFFAIPLSDDDDDVMTDIRILLSRNEVIPPQINARLKRGALDPLILDMTRAGASAREIAQRLGIAERTVVRRRTAHSGGNDVGLARSPTLA